MLFKFVTLKNCYIRLFPYYKIFLYSENKMFPVCVDMIILYGLYCLTCLFICLALLNLLVLIFHGYFCFYLWQALKTGLRKLLCFCGTQMWTCHNSCRVITEYVFISFLFFSQTSYIGIWCVIECNSSELNYRAFDWAWFLLWNSHWWWTIIIWHSFKFFNLTLLP